MANANNKTKNFLIALTLGASIGAFGLLTASLVNDAYADEYRPPVVTGHYCDYPDNNGVRVCYEKYDNGNQETYFRHYAPNEGRDLCTESYPVLGDETIPCPTLPQRG